MERIEQEMVDAWYKRHEASKRKPYESYWYSKRFYLSDKEDDYRYLICSIYEPTNWSDKRWFEFNTQFENNDRSINIETVQRFNDPEEEYRPYPKLKEVEELFEKFYNLYVKND